MNLKQLKERKAELLNQMEDMCNNFDLFNSTKFNEMKVELEKVEKDISDFENNSVKIENVNRKESGSNKMKLKELLLNNKTVDLSMISNEGEMIRTDHDEVIHESFEKTIEKRIEEECLMFGLVRKIQTKSPHALTVQAEKLERFLNVKELASYQKAMPNYRQVVLGAEKYGLVVQLSEELVHDAAFDMEAEVQGQLVEAFAKTMEDLIINGDEENGVEGLLMAEAEEVKVAEVNYPALIQMIQKMPKAMRNDAVVVVADEFIQDLMLMVDLSGRPIFEINAGDMVDGRFDGKLLGHKVIISPELKGDAKAIFVNLQKAMVVGLRQGMQLRRSEEVGFLQDSITLKANCRLDAKILEPKAIVKLVKEGE